MTPKVFGIGWAKTGTTSLGRAMQELGYEHLVGPRFDLVDLLAGGDVRSVLEAATAYESFDDWPWPLVFREVDEAHPGSRFVLTTRSREGWKRSWTNMVRNEDGAGAAAARRRRAFIYGEVAQRGDVDDVADLVEAHNEAVVDWFAGRPDSLLVVDWESGDGWQELCGFLERPAPDRPFPHSNRGRYARGWLRSLADRRR